MLLFNKNLGETPLEMLERLRAEQPELKDAKLTYAGRLDPMATGSMLVLVGDEVYEKEKYLGLDKEYIAEFVVGIATDTGDLLGLVTKEEKASVIEETIQESLKKIKNLQRQTYPWFSGKTVEGKKLFEYFKERKTDIERPTLEVAIHEAEFLGLRNLDAQEFQDYLFSSLQKVNGDFRQKEITERWKKYFLEHGEPLQIFKVRFLVSGGTFIRALTEEFPFSATVYALNRTKIIGIE